MMAKYITTLKPKPLPSMKEMVPGKDVVFRDVSALCHRPESAENWFASCHVRLLNWPGQTAWSNAIENLCHIFWYETSKRPTAKRAAY